MTTIDQFQGHQPEDVFIDIANLRLYRDNAFRVLGLPVTVSGTEITRHEKKLTVFANLGASPSGNHSSVLPLSPPPDPQALRKAAQRLHDVKSRLLDEIFWFWPFNGQPLSADAGYVSLLAGNMAAAHREWAAIGKADSNYVIARHNLAVMHHALALDMEHLPSDRPSDADFAKVDQHWKFALLLWTKLARKESFWTLVASRAVLLDDPRLSTAFVGRMRESLPAAILSISINYALRAAKEGYAQHARRHLIYIRDSGADQKLALLILEREAAPMVTHVRHVCEQLLSHSSDPEKMIELSRTVLTDCSTTLAGIRAILPRHNHLRQTAFDLVAATVRECMIKYANATEDWAGTIENLEHAEGLAHSDGLSKRLRDDLTQAKEYLAHTQHVEDLTSAVTGNQVYEVTIRGSQLRFAQICTCCLAEATDKQTVSYSWEEIRGLKKFQRSLSFEFPVCGICRQHQSEYSQKRMLLVLLAAGMSTAIAFLFGGSIQKVDWLPFVIGGGVFTLGIAYGLSAVLRLRALPEQHACRDRAVEMTSANDHHVTLRFHNPLYAEAFSHSNNVAVTKRQMTKPTRGTYILAGRGTILALAVAVVLGAAGQTVMYATTAGGPASSSPKSSRSSPANKPDAYSRLGTRVQPQSNGRLASMIDDSRSRTEELEAEVSKMDSELESLSTMIRRYKRDLQDFEDDIERGVQVDQDDYEEALGRHNRCATEYNTLLDDRNEKCDEYKNEIESLNDMVRRFNRGER